MFFSRRAGDKYQSRGDNNTDDWTDSDLTLDGTWNDLDMSSKIPVGTKLVHITIEGTSEIPMNYIYFRKKGYSATHNSTAFQTVVGAMPHVNNIWIEVDKDGICQYLASESDWTSIKLSVCGSIKK